MYVLKNVFKRKRVQNLGEMIKKWNEEGGLMYSEVKRGIEVKVEKFYMEVK